MRRHKQKVEAAKRDVFRSRHVEVNTIDFRAAWDHICDLDPGLPREDPVVDDLKRAIVGLSRRVHELEHEWS